MSYTVPLAELRFRVSRARGPGGQHVNKTATRVEVMWDIGRTETLTDAERARVQEKLARRIDARGFLRVASENRRSQLQNKVAAIATMNRLVQAALRVPKPRRKTSRPKAADEARLAAKKRLSDKKQRRRPVSPDE